MTRLKFILSFLILANVCNGQTWTWAKSGKGTAAGEDEGMSVNTDVVGNVFITGIYEDSIKFFGTDTLTSDGSGDAYVVKYDASGNVLWANNIGGTGTEWGNSVATDVWGNSFVTGFFSSPTLILGTDTLTNTGVENVFLVKYDPNGNVLWAKSSIGTSGDMANSVCTDAMGNSFITGSFLSPTITLGTFTLTNGGSQFNMFIAKYDINGNVLWAKSAGNVGFDLGNSVCTDSTGNIFVTGFFQSPTITFGTYTLNNTGVQNVFVAKYNTSGNVLWAKSAVGSYGDQGNSICTDTKGNAFVTGFFKSDTISFDTFVLPNSMGTNYTNIFIAKYDSIGNVLWAKSAGGTGGPYGDVGYSVSAYNNSVFVAGSLSSPSITFGGYVLTPPIGSPDPMFIANYDSVGNVVYATYLISGGDDINAISVDRFCNAYISGDFLTNPFIVGPDTLVLTGLEDTFVAKLSFPCNLTAINYSSQKTNNEILIYPNPNNGSFDFNIENQNEKGELILFNSIGQKVYTKQIQQGINKINTTNLSNGLYYYNIQFDLKTSCSGKIVIE